MPEQTKADWGTEVEAAVVRIGPAKGAELAVRTKSETLDLLGRLPESDRVYLEQMMYAAYCSALRADSKMPESEKASLIRTYNEEVRSTIHRMTSKPATNRAAPPKPAEPPSGKDESSATGSRSQNTAARITKPASSNYSDLDLDSTTTVGLVTTVWDPTENRPKNVTWKVPLRWGEIFELAYPYLVSWPHDELLRGQLANAIAEKRLDSSLSNLSVIRHQIQEISYQAISIELRTRKLVKVERMRTETGGSAVFWGETALGQSVIQAVRKVNRDAELRMEGARKQFSNDPSINALIDSEANKRAKEIVAKQQEACESRIAVLERRLAGQVVMLETLQLERERLSFFVELGQVWKKVDGSHVSIESVTSSHLGIRSGGSSRLLKVPDEWDYSTKDGHCTLTVVKLEGHRALVSHECRSRQQSPA
jgi:hypothetical protein